MAVYRPKRNGVDSKFYVCEFVMQGKRVQECTGCDKQDSGKGVRNDGGRNWNVRRPAFLWMRGHTIRSVSEVM